MGVVERLRLRELKARIKQGLGRRTGDRRLAAEGRTDEAEARLLRTKARITDMARDFRRGRR
ncbi:CsbD family protein [Streptosporangium sp. KLBMP 9127]|nr:CsbD family protein [Streptosporangium sp. KLBMP 9127]